MAHCIVKYSALSLFALLVLAMFSPQANACDTSQCSVSILPITNQTIAVNSGSWDAPTTWNTGIVPGANKNVVIPVGITVTYNINIALTAAAPIRSILVSGALTFDKSNNSALVVDTLVIDSSGILNIGTDTAPIQADKTAKVVFAGGDISTLDDPQLKGRGLLNHGTININGATKTSYISVSGTGDVVGSVIALSSAPVGWRVGDTVLVTGSDPVELPTQSTQVTSSQYETHDELRVITAVSGATVTIDNGLGALRSNGLPNKHTRQYPGMPIYMANMTRNVQFSTSAANIDNISRRGHTMFMSSPNVSIKNAAFVDLGRSDKSYPLTAKFANGVIPGSSPLVTTTGSDTVFNSNMRGRYPVHFHKIGVSQTTPITFTGNVIMRSPGWGVSLHTSFANVSDNVSYDIFASHFVTEDGNERGHFDHNLAVKSVGDTVDDFQVDVIGGQPVSLSRKISKGYWSYDNTYNTDGSVASIAKLQDDGQTGNCFWMQSRNIEFTNNTANSCSQYGFMFFHRHISSGDTPYALLTTPHRDLISWHNKISNTLPIVFDANEVPLVNITNNESVASDGALIVVKANNNQNHNIYNHIKGIRGFATGDKCLEFGYTGHYFVEDIGCYSRLTKIYRVAMDTNVEVENIIFKDFNLVGWDYPVDVNLTFSGLPNTTAATFINGSVTTKSGITSEFDPASHIFAFNYFPRVSAYLPELQKVVAPNSDMLAGSGFVPYLTGVSIPPIVMINGWWNSKYIWTATLHDSAGIAPSNSYPYGISSFESKWIGKAVRARWEEKINNVFVNRSTTAEGVQCVILHDHFADRVNGAVVPFDVCVPMVSH
jgi:hypothetical protein